jgi:hypothetical protein
MKDRLRRLKDVADRAKDILKTPLDRLRELFDDLNDAIMEGFITLEEATASFLKQREGILGLGGDGGESPRGESRAIRSAFVSVAGLSMQGLNPQVQEQKRTNTLMEQNNRLLTSIDNKEGIR